MNVKITGTKLTIEMDLQEPTASTSGKSLVVASTGGFSPTGAVYKGKPLKLNVTGIIPVTK